MAHEMDMDESTLMTLLLLQFYVEQAQFPLKMWKQQIHFPASDDSAGWQQMDGSFKPMWLLNRNQICIF